MIPDDLNKTTPFSFQTVSNYQNHQILVQNVESITGRDFPDENTALHGATCNIYQQIGLDKLEPRRPHRKPT